MVRREHYPLCVARSSTFKFPSGFVFPQNQAAVCSVRFRAVILDRCIKSLRGELQRLLLHLVQARSAIFPPLEHWSKILGHLLRHERTTAALLRSVPEIHSSSSLQASPLRSFTRPNVHGVNVSITAAFSATGSLRRGSTSPVDVSPCVSSSLPDQTRAQVSTVKRASPAVASSSPVATRYRLLHHGISCPSHFLPAVISSLVIVV